MKCNFDYSPNWRSSFHSPLRCSDCSNDADVDVAHFYHQTASAAESISIHFTLMLWSAETSVINFGVTDLSHFGGDCSFAFTVSGAPFIIGVFGANCASGSGLDW